MDGGGIYATAGKSAPAARRQIVSVSGVFAEGKFQGGAGTVQRPHQFGKGLAGPQTERPAYQGARPFPYPVPCPPATSAISGSASSGTTAASPKMRLEERLPATRHAVRHRHNSPPLSGMLPAVSAFPCGSRPARRTPPAPDGRAHRPLQFPASDGIRQRHESTPTP